ncbi:MAG: ATP synthase F1 subunit gamma [Bryobacteraceae bacterium]|nr:ATP synthase F1 subunit gamma [Bryobacteraceae bacterium]
MPTLLDFRRRVRSVRNTQQITRAMKFVAAAKLRRAQERVFAARPYARQILRVMRSAMGRVPQPRHPLMIRRAEERILLLVLSGDKGLCGAFNANIIRRAVEFLDAHRDQQVLVIPIGKKVRDALRKRRVHFLEEYINVSQRVEFAPAQEMARQVIDRYSRAEVDAVYVLYNEFKSVLAQRLVVEKLLPVEPERLTESLELAGRAEAHPPRPTHPAPPMGAVPVDYLYEQPPEQILARVLERHVETQIFRILLESAAAEHAARMTAMDSATNNAAELIESLTLHMNKVRQATITKEIIEVVSGAAAPTTI